MPYTSLIDAKIYFYNIKTKTLKKEYRNICDRINLIDSHFYVITYQPPKKLFIFNQEGELVDESSVESISEYIGHEDGWDCFMFSTNDNLFVLSLSGENTNLKHLFINVFEKSTKTFILFYLHLIKISFDVPIFYAIFSYRFCK